MLNQLEINKLPVSERKILSVIFGEIPYKGNGDAVTIKNCKKVVWRRKHNKNHKSKLFTRRGWRDAVTDGLRKMGVHGNYISLPAHEAVSSPSTLVSVRLEFNLTTTISLGSTNYPEP